MTNLEKTGALAGLVLPLLVGAWWAAAGYVEVSDRLEALEEDMRTMEALRDTYTREQARDSIVNEQVADLSEQVEWMRYHHHSIPDGEDTGRAHVD